MEEQDIKRAGLKITQPRVKILDLLSHSSEHHLSAEDIYKSLLTNGEEIGLATVYRVLTQFEAAGLVNRHHFEGGQAVFELASEEHHDHMVCMRTGRVVEFYDEVIEQRQRELARKHNFRIKDHSLILYGEFIGENEETA
ncbi:ferric iron uptake transcriptional regulator [Candidatus Thiothrix sp. Deng01]|uniref:Ferric uptake regulation protein n=2 Tax=Thiothrix TaxID=1030 RepID=A0A7L6AN37_9GAMM|nr:ferric iron uptake transcriptional regulator [Candidatus Thiothrix sp. Deng01]MEB4591946.1 ferric iron uptake transcriptional regulator [Candidatus Thiothrix sp. Deng01]QLQ30449.1 MAG: ferric iron uptake transcriptional regulator [Candidatus Thiothrix singaporensis]